MLIEAKSLTDVSRAVDRMRYGIGQLADYASRYKQEVGDAKRLLAFGRPPDKETSWISTVLQETGVAFVAAENDRLLPLNESAREIGLF